MPLEDSRAQGFALAQQVFGTASNFMTAETNREFLLQKMAGIEGVTEQDIQDITSGDRFAKARALSAILQKPNGLDAVQTISGFLASQAQTDAVKAKQPDMRLAAGPLADILKRIGAGESLTPEQAAMQIPESAFPGFAALAGQGLSAESRNEIAALRTALGVYGQNVDFTTKIADLERQLTEFRTTQGAAGGAAATKFGDTFAQRVLGMLDDPQWPGERQRATTSTLAAFADQVYASYSTDHPGEPVDQAYVQSQLWEMLNNLGVKPGAKGKTLEEAVRVMQERMGQPREPAQPEEPQLPEKPALPPQLRRFEAPTGAAGGLIQAAPTIGRGAKAVGKVIARGTAGMAGEALRERTATATGQVEAIAERIRTQALSGKVKLTKDEYRTLLQSGMTPAQVQKWANDILNQAVEEAQRARGAP